ncbi:hypothetical protein AGLY_001610 [Aphis glycines]|uniref:Transmembrane protein n=1 Tax=Aphis glycines TaxID=307491 RepID=A0A6G0U5N2_APHGL|nr:hypothetical protein AGLY_001610 [Aphis glycines]
MWMVDFDWTNFYDDILCSQRLINANRITLNFLQNVHMLFVKFLIVEKVWVVCLILKFKMHILCCMYITLTRLRIIIMFLIYYFFNIIVFTKSCTISYFSHYTPCHFHQQLRISFYNLLLLLHRPSFSLSSKKYGLFYIRLKSILNYYYDNYLLLIIYQKCLGQNIIKDNLFKEIKDNYMKKIVIYLNYFP